MKLQTDNNEKPKPLELNKPETRTPIKEKGNQRNTKTNR